MSSIRKRLLTSFTHRALGFEDVALGLFRCVLGHDVLRRLIANHVAEDGRVVQSTGPHIRRKLGVLPLIWMTVNGAAKSTAVELFRRKLAYSLVLQNDNGNLLSL